MAIIHSTCKSIIHHDQNTLKTYLPSFIFERTVSSRKQGGNFKKLPHPRPYQFQAISML